MGDPNHYRFDQTQRGIAPTRYGFVRDKLLQVQRHQTVTQPIPSLGNRFPCMGLNVCGQYQPLNSPFGNSNRPLKRSTACQFGVKIIKSRKFPSVEITLLSHQFVSLLLSHHKDLLRLLPNRISLRQYVLVAGDTS
ncbi:hypothetical protein ACL6C3_04755 [Capilliphycus salinus ALCB114379]|uniref:hypothetical protein n=1 Tax=Capilliphycus salinus TaxID=2768948 RepID=UPI0039A4E9F5